MKAIIFRLCFVLFSTFISFSYAGEENSPPSDCEKRLEQFVPRAVDTSSLAMRAVVRSTRQQFFPTEEMRRKQLTEQYWSSEKYQKSAATPEAFIDSVMPLIEAEEHVERSTPPRQWTTEVIVSATNAYARYSDAAEMNTTTQEVFIFKVSPREWRTVCVDHIHKYIVESVARHANEYFNYFMALTPQEAHRTSWNMYPVMLRMEKRDENIARLLCEDGKVQLANILIQVEFTDETHCVFKTQTPVPNGNMNTEYELELNKNVRLLRYELNGPELTTKVTYEYSDTESLWPSKQHLVDRNILSDQTLLDRTLEIVEVAPSTKWNINALLNDVMKKYPEYSYIQK